MHPRPCTRLDRGWRGVLTLKLTLTVTLTLTLTLILTLTLTLTLTLGMSSVTARACPPRARGTWRRGKEARAPSRTATMQGGDRRPARFPGLYEWAPRQWEQGPSG